MKVGDFWRLTIFDAAERLEDLRIPPGNWLEKLAGDREGQYSIRMNNQWRICFQWSDGDAYDVEVVGYFHQEEICLEENNREVNVFFVDGR